MKTLFFTVIILYLFIMLAMYVLQRKLMYFPAKGELSISSVGLDTIGAEKLQLTTADNVKLTAWYKPPSTEDSLTILYFHGNADNMTADFRVYRYREFARAGYGFLALSYRGYGDSEGTPSEEGLYNDARAAIRYLTEEQGTALGNIVLFGESLGSGVAVQMATEYAAGALFLDSPYTSTVNRAQELYPWLPVGLLMKDKYESFKKIAKIHPMKLVIFHGNKDEVIPIEHGKKLLSLANDPKVGRFMDGVPHVEAPMSIILEELEKLHSR